MDGQEIGGDEKLWRIEIGIEDNLNTFYIVSAQKPMLIFESPFGKLRRMFDVFPAKNQSRQTPVFHISSEESATVKLTKKMHGFKLRSITAKSIILSVDNPQKNSLYEISLFKRKVKNFIRKKYIIATDKREAVKIAEKFKKNYLVRIKKAKKMDCYPILNITDTSIILGKVKL